MLYQRSKLKQTAVASIGVPSENLTPDFRENVQVLPSLLDSHFSAREGSRSAVPGLFWIRVSQICRVIRKGSPSPLNAGSNIFGLPAAPKIIVPPVPPPAPSSRLDSAQADSETASAPASPIRATRRVRVSRNCCIWHPLGDVRVQSHRPVGQELDGRSVCSPTLAGTRPRLKYVRLRSRYVGVDLTAMCP